MPEGLMLVNVLPAFGLNEVNITTPLFRMKKNLKNHEKKFATNKKIPTFAIPNKKGRIQFFEVYFWMDTRRLDDEGGSYLLVMTD